jgi:hypothetical protein
LALAIAGCFDFGRAASATILLFVTHQLSTTKNSMKTFSRTSLILDALHLIHQVPLL